ncbi:MAG: glutaredoxin family protein [Candidatus Woesearchaeota archaeon]
MILAEEKENKKNKEAQENKGGAGDPKTGNPKVRIYSTPTCPYCNMAKEFFKENGVEYEEFNVAEDENARNEMVERSGQMGVPVIDINGTVIVGFDKEKVKEELGI